MSRVPLTTNQRRGFLAAWGGWVLDGMDSFIYALVMTPALRELLPRSGIPGDQSHIGYYGGVLFALFLVGWGCLLLWGVCVRAVSGLLGMFAFVGTDRRSFRTRADVDAHDFLLFRLHFSRSLCHERLDAGGV